MPTQHNNAEQGLVEGVDVWVPDVEHAWVRAFVHSIGSNSGFVHCKRKSDGQVVEVPVGDCFHINPAEMDCADDMTSLMHLNEPAILHTLDCRYRDHKIYTFVGDIMIAMNPYTDLPLYGPDLLAQYSSKTAKGLPPHLFATANECYSRLVSESTSFSIVISGESGAGKTESAKIILQYLSHVGAFGEDGRSVHVARQILQATPLLESCGNAKTLRNDNSSRFGKFLEVHFDRRGHMVGAAIRQYLLEKSRLVKQSEGERNYHIFYALLAGASPKQKAELKLTSPSHYHYTNQSSCHVIDGHGSSEAQQFTGFMDALSAVDISPEDQSGVLRTLAALLHLGNASFVEDGDGNATIESALTFCASLLGVSTDALQNALLCKAMRAGGETVFVPRRCDDAVYSRDALAKECYGRVFSFLVSSINATLHWAPSNDSSLLYVGVLDLFGFEQFETNSFEQLCINYANEKFQLLFNDHVLRLEQVEFESEGLQWSTIDYPDNSECVEHLEKANGGLFALLDDECVFPNASDGTFLGKLTHSFKKYAFFSLPKPSAGKPVSSSSFLISHYAAVVCYDSKGFLDKNNDLLHVDLQALVSSSSDRFVSKLFPPAPAPPSSSKKNALISVGSRFKEQLSVLMRELATTRLFFVRCIKPNSEKSPTTLERPAICHQLHCGGVVGAVRIKQRGWPTRLTFRDFCVRYGFLRPELRLNSSMYNKEGCEKLLAHLPRLDADAHCCGRTKVFFRRLQLERLEEAVAVRRSEASRVVQPAVRGWLVRKRVVLIRAARMLSYHVLRALRHRLLAVMFEAEIRRLEEEARLARERREAERRAAEEAERKRRAAGEAERKRKEAAEAERRRKEEEKARQLAEEQRRAEEERRVAAEIALEREREALRQASAPLPERGDSEQQQNTLQPESSEMWGNVGDDGFELVIDEEFDSPAKAQDTEQVHPLKKSSKPVTTPLNALHAALLLVDPEILKATTADIWQLAHHSEECPDMLSSPFLTRIISLIRQQSAPLQARTNAAAIVHVLASSIERQLRFVLLGAAEALVGLLNETSNPEAATRCAAALWVLSDAPGNHAKIAAAGALSVLVRVVHTGTPEPHSMACACLWRLARNEENQVKIASLGGIEVLIARLSSPNVNVQAHSAVALQNLARNASNKALIGKAGGIERLAALLQSPVPQVKAMASGALWNLAGNDDNKRRIMSSGAVELLVEVLRCSHTDAQCKAAAALRNLAGTPEYRIAIASAGSIEPLVTLLRSPSLEVQGKAAAALWRLAKAPELKQEIVDAGSIPLLQEASLASNREVRSIAASLLSALTADERPSASSSEAELHKCVEQLNNPKTDATTAMKAASWFVELAGSPAGQASLINADAIPALIASCRRREAGLILRSVHALMLLARNKEAQVLIASNGGIAALVGFLPHFHSETATYAAMAVQNVACAADNKQLIIACGALPHLATLLQGNEQQANDAIGVVWNLSSCPKSKISIVSAGLVPLLVDLLSSSLEDTQAKSAAALRNIAGVDEFQSVIAEHGAIPPLVALLSSPSTETAVKAAGCLWRLARHDDNQQAITAAGAIIPLVRLLTSHSVEIQATAAAALSNLARLNDGKMKIAESGAIPLLACLAASPNVETASMAAGCLWNLAGNDANRRAIVEAGAIAPLVALLSCHDGEAQAKGAAALRNLASSVEIQQAIAKAGAIPALVKLLGNGSRDAQAKASAALWRLARNDGNQQLIAQAGAIPHLVALLNSHNSDAHPNCAAALSNLARAHGNKEAIISCGGISVLVKRLSSKNSETQAMAAGALWNLCGSQPGIQKAIIEEGALGPLLDMLLSHKGQVQAMASGAVWALAHHDENRQKFIDGGAVSLLHKLASANGEATKYASAALRRLGDARYASSKHSPSSHRS